MVPHRLEEGKSAREDAGPRRGWIMLAPKRVDLGVVPHRLEEGKSASKDAGPRRGWITLGPKGGGFVGGPTSIGGMKECQRGRWASKLIF